MGINVLVCQGSGGNGGESKGLSAEVRQSAAAGLLWLRKVKCDQCGNDAGGPRKGLHTAQL